MLRVESKLKDTRNTRTVILLLLLKYLIKND